MPSPELTREASRVLTVCNACRYCEQYCPVFPAMERRLRFTAGDVNYLANLCHNCGECLYACQYAPPHEFGINVPRTLSTVRVASYEQYAWPSAVGAAFRRHSLGTGLGLAVVLTLVMLAATLAVNGDALRDAGDAAAFYAVVPHDVLVAMFGTVSLWVVVVLTIGVRRCWRDIGGGQGASVSAVRDVLTLRHLHATGTDCVTAEERRTPTRRWFHHCTFYGFLLCGASTSVAALYHASGWPAPYGYTSLPVLLGTLGGLGLVVGPLGLWGGRLRRDPMLGDPSHRGLDDSFLGLLLLTSMTGLLLLLFRHRSWMGVLLIVHLGAVLALFVTLPYGKFVHGLYRTVALLKASGEERTP